MKIGILGAPGSGKSELAQGIRAALVDKFEFHLIDHYVEDLSEWTGNAYGHFAGYIGNFEIAFHRISAEQHQAQKSGHTITCGTVVDTMIYAAMHSQFAKLNAPDQRAEYARVSTSMHMFSMLVADTFDYDLTFYLPYTQERRQETDGEWNTLLDLEYAGIFPGIDIAPVLLDDGDVNNLAKAVQHVFERANDEPVYAKTVE